MAGAMNDESETVDDPMRMPRFQAAYLRMQASIEGIAKHELLVVNLDIPSVVMMVLGSITEIRKMRKPCEKSLLDFNLALFEEIEPLALAMGYTHSLHAAASMPVLQVDHLSTRAVEIRQMLATDCAALAQRGLIDGGRLKQLKGPVGYKNQAFDLLTLVALMRDRWRRIKGKSAVSAAELDEAESIADQLLTAVGEREQLPMVTAAAADTRRRAFTLFVRAYNELRRTAEYLRWHTGDPEVFVPSLYPAKKPRKAVQQALAKAVAAPLPAPESTPSPENGKSVPNGMPGSDPFSAS